MAPPALSRRARTAALGGALVLGAGLAGCAAEARPQSAGKLQVVTTVAPITSIAANVGGDLVQIHGLVPEGTNSHTFEPPPSAARLLAEADLILVNGLKLEEPTRALAESAGARAAVVEIGDRVLPEAEYIYDFSFPRSEGKPNPHLWTDPLYAVKYAAVIRDEYAARDAAHAADYRRNYDAFAARATQLADALRAATATVPAGNRRLLTYHDAYAYFARDFGWTVVGAIQPADFSEPTPREVARLIEQVRALRVPAIFGSEVFPSKVLEQVGRETGARYVDVLRDDDLPGRPGDPEHSWLGLMRFDYITMVEALGGDAAALRAVPTTDVAPDNASYPQ